MGNYSSDTSNWKERYDELYAKHSLLLQQRPLQAVTSKISDAAVDGFVKELLADPNINIYALPDALEGALYRNILKTILHAMAHATDATGVILLGHKIKIVIEPLQED